MYSFLNTYYGSSSSHSINGRSLTFYECKIYFDINELQNDNEAKPIIALIGDRKSKTNSYKCLVKNAAGQDVRGYEDRFRLDRSFFVKVNRISDKEDPVVGSRLQIDRVVDSLTGIFSTKIPDLSGLGIYYPELNTAVDMSTAQEYVAKLNFKCEIRFTYHIDN